MCKINFNYIFYVAQYSKDIPWQYVTGLHVSHEIVCDLFLYYVGEIVYI